MTPRRISAGDLASVLPRKGRVLVQGTSGESQLFANAIMDAGERLQGLVFTGIFIPGVNRHDYLASSTCGVETFFLTPQLTGAGERVTFLPLCYADIRARLRSVPIAAMMAMVSPPDENGLCSFGPAVDFLAEIWPDIPIRIAHINPDMPRTPGHPGIPFDELTAFVEANEPLVESAKSEEDAVSRAIGEAISRLVPDGACIQSGVGKIPGAVLGALHGHKNLRIHSGLVTDDVVDLEQAGALSPDHKIVAGVALGTSRLYEVIGSERFDFRPVSVTHDAALIAAIPNFISINSAFEVDLYGQVYSEVGPKGLASGPGGASDYARAARLSDGGLRIIALPSTGGRSRDSRIVPAGMGKGPVSLGRMDVDIVVTEHGSADLRGKDYDARAQALLDIADPEQRGMLDQSWSAYFQNVLNCGSA